MNDCIFCKIAAGEIPANKIYEDDKILCFHDLNPQAPVHALIIPKNHVAGLSDLEDAPSEDLGHILKKIPEICDLLGLTGDDGFRFVANCGVNAGQTVFHLHFHLLGGRMFTWPPG